MDRKAFHLLLKKYLDDTCSDVERRLVDQWYVLLDDETLNENSDDNSDEVESRIWENIHQHLNQPEVRIIPVRDHKISVRRLLIAASFIAIIASAWLLRSHFFEPVSMVAHKVQEGMLEEFNHGTVARHLVLEDGSSLCLQPNAKIAYPSHFSKTKREVYLEGEAFFNVAKNPGCPFFVYNNNLVAEVLGTSFNIKIVSGKIEVAVCTGRVAVFENGQQVNLNPQQKLQNGVIVTPNQKVTYNPENRIFETALVESPKPVSLEKDSILHPVFVFDDTPLLKVLSELEKAYQIDIVLENDNIGNCPFTGDISKQTLYNKLEVVCSVFRATYEVKGTRILIKGGKGCN